MKKKLEKEKTNIGRLEEISGAVDGVSLHVDPDACFGCEVCVGECPNGAITMVNGRAKINEPDCVSCGSCARVCPAGAIYE